MGQKKATEAKASAAYEQEKESIAQQAMESAKQLHASANRMRHDGEKADYSAERIERFFQAEIEGLRDPENADQYKAPLAIVLPGAITEEWGDEGCGIAINSAFESPDNHS